MGRCDSFVYAVHRSVLPGMSFAVLVMLVLAIVLPDNAREKSLGISQPTMYNIMLDNVRTRTIEVANELDEQCQELAQLLTMAAAETDTVRAPSETPLSRRVLARTNAENNSPPPTDGSGLPMYGAFFHPTITTFAALNAHPYVPFTENAIMIMRPIIQATPELDQLYIAYDDGLIFWLEKSYERADVYVNGTFLNGCTGLFGVGYKPQCDPWFLAARKLNGTVAFSQPYVDYDTGELVLTLSLTLSSVPGVFGVDRDMSAMDAAVRGIPGSLTPRGYRMLIHRNGTVITHPEFTNRTRTIHISALEPSIHWPTMLTAPVSTPTVVIKHGDEWLISCSGVARPGWVVCTMLPKSDATARGDVLLAKHQQLKALEVGLMLPVSILCLVGLWWWDRRVSKPIVSRLNSFAGRLDVLVSADKTTLLPTDLNKSIADPRRTRPPATDLAEIEGATDQLRGALIVNQFAPTTDRNQLIQQHRILIEARLQATQPRVQAVYEARVAQITAQLARQNLSDTTFTYEKALACIDYAIAISRDLCSVSNPSESDRIALANRLNTRGDYLSKLGRTKEANDAFAESLQKHAALDNAQGFTHVAINRAALILQEPDPPAGIITTTTTTTTQPAATAPMSAVFQPLVTMYPVTTASPTLPGSTLMAPAIQLATFSQPPSQSAANVAPPNYEDT